MKKTSVIAGGLTIAGLLPFVFSAGCIVFFNSGVPVTNLLMAFVSYGAICLAFWGAVQWGLSLETDRAILVAGAESRDVVRLLLGVIPATLAWLAICLAFMWSAVMAVALLAVAVPLQGLAERAGWRRGMLPRGYMGLRWIAVAVMESCLLVVLMARLF
ncbi:DUF3429 domain-containing protein [Acetobacter thailandicus]|uniref:DUF3429 domain-containing protein n=1 Tax=Acetobacter thailandicus TaxID=1502842 RepID=UPI001BABB559|nr:DUF3429 domain-containing protein [Acetobacter thailandicus]MBS1002678.1 DUF3429 domain-containing protein [Acetobacter thailandicus]